MALLTNINGKFSVSDAGAVTFNNAFTFPTADGDANYVLQTNGSGQIGWAENGSVTGSGSATRVAFWSSGSAITSDADLYWDNTNKRLGIGISSIDAKLQIDDGSIKISNIVTSSPDDAVQRLINVASFDGGGSTYTGQLIIQTPVMTTGAMVKLKISGWQYDESWDLTVSGYMRFGTGRGWQQIGGSILTGNPPFSVDEVRLAYNDTTNIFYVILGSSSTFWDYYASIIVDADQFYQNSVPTTGWDMSVSTSDPSGLVNTVTLTDIAKYGTGGDSALIPGDVGIGTTDPDADLHVNSLNAQGTLMISRSGSNLAATNNVGSITFPADYNSTPTTYASIKAYANALSAVRGSLDLNVKSTSGGLLTGLTVYGTNSGPNVGIGTVLPDTLLNIEGSSPILTIEDSRTSIGNGTIMGRIDFKQNDDSGSGTGVSGSIYSISSSATGQGSDLAFTTGVPGSTTEKMRIQSTTGNVGIGETSPSNLLDIKSNGSSKGLDIHHSNGNMVAQLIHGGSGDEGQLKLYDSNIETVKIAGESGVNSFINSGNVTIGGTAVDQAGSFSVKSNGFIRGVLASGSNESSLINAIAGVSNGFQLMNNASNEQEYRFHSSHTGGPTISFKIEPSGTITAAGDVVAYSDKRLKSNIKTLDGSKVYDMRGVSFIKDNKKGSGVIAQEIQKIAPELVNDGSEYLGVAYGNLSGYLIEAIKELKAEIEELKSNKCNCNK